MNGWIEIDVNIILCLDAASVLVLVSSACS